MIIDKTKYSISGIYAIRNIITNKLYIGKSKDIYKRLHQHLSDIKHDHRNHNENPYLLKAFKKYSKENFECIILEIFNTLNEKQFSERELYWIDKYNTINRQFGYNLRRDSSTNMIVHQETRDKISRRLKKEWKCGIRDKHSEKLSKNWKENPSRGISQGKLFSDILTKYYYIVSKDDIIIKLKYSQLKDYNLQNCLATFKKKNSNIIRFKGYIMEKVKINNEDIVQPD